MGGGGSRAGSSTPSPADIRDASTYRAEDPEDTEDDLLISEIGYGDTRPCDYCGVQQYIETLKDHVIQDCPLLCQCLCGRLVTIPHLWQHWLHDCRDRDEYRECDLCRVVVHVSNVHHPCPEDIGSAFSRCPLCWRSLFTGADELMSWRRHLIEECDKNPVLIERQLRQANGTERTRLLVRLETGVHRSVTLNLRSSDAALSSLPPAARART